jgi:hypothetical protein
VVAGQHVTEDDDGGAIEGLVLASYLNLDFPKR